MERRKIKFSSITSLFDPNKWDVGYLSAENMDRAGNTPIKAKFHYHGGFDLTNHIHNTSLNGIVLVRYTDEANNYSLYEESSDILKDKFGDRTIPTYSNFKESALLSGLGYRAKNSLVYNRKFGFQSKICVFMFIDEIVNYENLSPNKDLLDLCDGCNDCIKNCPVGAIKEDWIDARKCDNFVGFGNHPTISSTKWFWYEKMRPNISREEVEGWDCYEKAGKFEWGQGIDGYYESDEMNLYKDGNKIGVPNCRECVCQPRCSKVPLFNS